MLVLEFMEGGDMWSALRGPHREELQWYGRGRSLALDIARGLHFLHEHKAGPLLQTPQVCLVLTAWATPLAVTALCPERRQLSGVALH